jgi:hypothetical protein
MNTAQLIKRLTTYVYVVKIVMKMHFQNNKHFQISNIVITGHARIINIVFSSPTPVVAQSKVWVCGRLLAGIAGSNPA